MKGLQECKGYLLGQEAELDLLNGLILYYAKHIFFPAPSSERNDWLTKGQLSQTVYSMLTLYQLSLAVQSYSTAETIL